MVFDVTDNGVDEARDVTLDAATDTVDESVDDEQTSTGNLLVLVEDKVDELDNVVE